jgi:hypothetical protein
VKIRPKSPLAQTFLCASFQNGCSEITIRKVVRLLSTGSCLCFLGVRRFGSDCSTLRMKMRVSDSPFVSDLCCSLVVFHTSGSLYSFLLRDLFKASKSFCSFCIQIGVNQTICDSISAPTSTNKNRTAKQRQIVENLPGHPQRIDGGSY